MSDVLNENEKRKAEEVAHGERCMQCYRYMHTSSPMPPRKCWQCRMLADPKEAIHDRLVRCPECGDTYEPEDGYTQQVCIHCSHAFVVQVHYSYTFTSPALNPREVS